jgi:hypothetical protein
MIVIGIIYDASTEKLNNPKLNITCSGAPVANPRLPACRLGPSGVHESKGTIYVLSTEWVGRDCCKTFSHRVSAMKIEPLDTL